MLTKLINIITTKSIQRNTVVGKTNFLVIKKKTII
jgi:hypothetical protein